VLVGCVSDSASLSASAATPSATGAANQDMAAPSSYSLEPTTRGVVLMKTTAGDVSIELFSRECPEAVFNFCQLAVDGLYNHTKFHRLVKDVLVQGGDPTGTGRGGSAYDGELFEDEFHSRLKFRRRGLLAMANSGARNSNASQFFFTLGPCEWLNGKHTIFGRVAGMESMGTLLKMADSQVGSDERPLQEYSILGMRILEEPFEDKMEPGESVLPASAAATPDVTPLAKPNEGKRNTAILSFGDDEEDEEQDGRAVHAKKVKTIHDLAKSKQKSGVANPPRDDSASESDTEQAPAATKAASPATTTTLAAQPAPAQPISGTSAQARDAKLADRLAAFKLRLQPPS
jgi:peptidyl-prolyl cis-trans isomerase SDCCAG10